MKRLILLLFLISLSNIYSQQVYGVQRGQRGYIPPPKYEASAYITTINAYEELEKVLPKSAEVFNLDDFEKEIFKGLLLKKYDDYNSDSELSCEEEFCDSDSELSSQEYMYELESDLSDSDLSDSDLSYSDISDA